MSEEEKKVWTPDSVEVRNISWNNFLLDDENYLGKWRTDSGIRITPETSLQSTVVLSCCRILAETISCLPLYVYRRLKDGSEELAKEVPLFKILSFSPNEWQTRQEFIEQLVMNVALWGNSYTRIRSGLYGSVSSLDNLHPSRMDVRRLENGRLRYEYTDPQTGKLELYSQDQIMHIRWTPEADGIKGMVPVEVAREAIGLARACEQHAARFWANAARPGVVLQTSGTLTAEAAERLRDNWERIHRGSERAYRTAVLTGGIEAKELGFTNESSQFVASRTFQTSEITRVYRIPGHLVQGDHGGDIETQGQEFVTYTLVPWLHRIESGISRSLIINDDEFHAKFDVRGLLRANSNARASYYSTMINLGVFCINDVRRHEGLPTLGEKGEHHFVPMNTQTLEEAVKPKPEAPPAGGPPPDGGGDGPPPPVPGGPPSMSGVNPGKAPIASPSGEASKPKNEESSAQWEDAVEDRAFCATGVGGGVKNDCGSQSSEVTSGDAAKKLERYKPFQSVGESKNSDFIRVPSDEEISSALKESDVQQSKIGANREIPNGAPVALRIDIPAWNKSGGKTYVVTVHEGKNPDSKKAFGSVIGYDSVARLSGSVQFSANDEDMAQQVAEGKSKTPLATVNGSFSNTREIPKDIDSWTPVGYDPQKATYFYDKKTGQEVTGGTDALSVGNTVFTREPKYGPRNAKTHYRSVDEMFASNSWGIETRSLSPANQELYLAQEKIVEEDGKWPQSGPDGAHYVTENPFASRGIKCANCLFFEAGACEIVEGQIDPSAVCRLWVIPEEKLSMDEESRVFCATGAGGGVKNDCGNASTSWQKTSDSEYKYSPGDEDSPIVGGDSIESIVIDHPKQVASLMKSLKIKSLTDVVAIAGGLTRGAFTNIRSDENEIHIYSEVPIDPDDESLGSMSSQVSLGIDPKGKKYVDYSMMSASSDSGEASFTGQDAARFGSLLLEKFPESLAAAEKAGVQYAKTYAIGDYENEFKGYRLWPKFGFDADIPPDIQRDIPKSLGGPKTIQGLLATPGGGKWWNENGQSLGMTLNFANKRGAGYKQYKRMAALSKRMKGRNEGRSYYDVMYRSFCPTGVGGGIDPSCGSGSSPSHDIIQKIIEKIASNPDGFTLDPLSAEQPTSGIMVSEFVNDSKRSVRIPAGKIRETEQAETLGRWYAQNSDLLVGQADRFIGGWRTGDDFYIDVATRFPPEKAAEALERGRNAKQLAVFNLETLKETWVKYDKGDSRKPPEYDKAFARAKRDTQAKQVYESDTPAIQDEDLVAELQRHGKNTVRNYNETSNKEDATHESDSTIRHPQQAHDHRGLSSDASLLREGRAVEGEFSGGGLVRRRPGVDAVALQGSAGVAERAWCATGPGGGLKNDCSPASAGQGPEVPSSPPPSMRLKSLVTSDKSAVSSSMKKLEVDHFDDLLALGGGTVRNSEVSVASEGDGAISVTTRAPIDPNSPDTGHFFQRVVALPDEGDGKTLELEAFGPSGDVEVSGPDRARLASIVSEKLIDAISTAERLGFSHVTTFAVGDEGNDYKGYRLWPQFGMDGPIDRKMIRKMPPELVLKAKGIPIPAAGSTQLPHDLVVKSLASRIRGLTVQELLSVPNREGDRWWDANGGDISLTLDLKDKSSAGYKRWEKAKSKLAAFKKRNEGRFAFDDDTESRVFCATGEGNGVDPTCGAGGSSGIVSGWTPGAAIPNVTQQVISSRPTERSEDGKRIVSTSVEGKTYSFGGRQYISTVDVGKHLSEQQAQSRGGEIINSAKPLRGDVREYVVSSHTQQVQSAMSRGVTPVFYTPEERRKQIEEYSVMEPKILGGRAKAGFEVSPENAEFILRAVQAVTSSNASPDANMRRTQAVLDKFFNGDGRVATSTAFGVTGNAIKKSLSRVQAIVDRLGKTTGGSVDTAMGLDRARQLFVGQTMRSGDVDSFFRDAVGGERGDWKPSSYLVDQMVPVFSIFGPKFGTFFANNNGDLQHLTADIWATRTFGRITGELIKPRNLAKIKEHSQAALSVIKSASLDMLHGYDGDQLVSSLKVAAGGGDLDDIARGWAGARLRHYAKGDFKEKRGIGGKLNSLAKKLVESDVSLMGDPGSGTRRANMIDVYSDVSRRTGLPVAYAQDVLWQDEQDAYAAAGAKTVTDVGAPSFYSDVIRKIASDPEGRFPRAKKERRSADVADPEYVDDYEHGGKENLLYLEAVSSMTDEDFVDKFLKLIEGQDKDVNP